MNMDRKSSLQDAVLTSCIALQTKNSGRYEVVKNFQVHQALRQTSVKSLKDNVLDRAAASFMTLLSGAIEYK